MDVEISEEFRLLHARVRDFVRASLEPISLQVEKEEAIPEETVDAIRRLGLFGMPVPKAYGGLGLTTVEEMLIYEELTQTVVIEGPDEQGLAGAVVARECGAARMVVTGVSTDERRFEMARLLGADHCVDVLKEDPVEKVRETTDGQMADLVMDVTGRPQGALTAVDLLKKGGTAVLPGRYGTTTPVPLLLDKVVLNEIRLQGVYSHDLNAVGPAIAIVESGRYPLEKMITHRFGLQAAEKALRTAAGEIPGEQPIKVVLVN